MTTPPSNLPPGTEAASALAHVGHGIEGGSGWQRREPLVVTALFDTVEAVDRALDALYGAGVPRDLIEVVVSREAALRFYGEGTRHGPRTPGRETFRYAGAGALIGFVAGVLFSLLMLVWPGIDAPGGMAPVALFGPNVGTISGGALGAVVGFFRHQRPDRAYARAAEVANAILLAVHARGAREAELLTGLITSQGGREAHVEAR